MKVIETNPTCAICKEKCKQPAYVNLVTCNHFAKQTTQKGK